MALLMSYFRSRAISSLSSSKNLINSTSHAHFSSSSAKTTKAVEIPDKPKRPLTPFFQYAKEVRPTVSLPSIGSNEEASNPQASVSRHLAELWKNVSAEKKLKYKELYEKERAEYVKKLALYEKNLTQEQKTLLTQVKVEKKAAIEKKALKSRIRDLGKPRAPPNAYILHYMDVLKKSPCKNREETIEQSKIAKASWDKMSDSEKKVYFSQYNKSKEQYKKELAVWEAKMINDGNTDVVPIRAEPKVPRSKDEPKSPRSKAEPKPKATKSK